MGLQDRIKAFGENSKQTTSMLDRKEYTPKTYYDGIQPQKVCIDSVDMLLGFVTSSNIKTLTISDNKINEMSFFNESERTHKDIHLSLDKIISELDQLKNDNSGYYSLQYGIDFLIEYIYEPLSSTPIVSVHNNHIEYYTLSVFEKMRNNLEQGKNAIMCGNTDFACLSTIMSNRFTSDRLLCINAPYINTISTLNLNPNIEQERSIYEFVCNRSIDEFIIINDPQNIEQMLSLWYSRTKILVYIPLASVHLALAKIEKYLTTDFMVERFLSRLDGVYSIKKENENVNCRYRTVNTFDSNVSCKKLCLV